MSRFDWKRQRRIDRNVGHWCRLEGKVEKVIETLKADREEGGDDDEYGVDPREVVRRKRKQ